MTNDNNRLEHGQLSMNQTTGIAATNTCALLLLTRPLDYEIAEQRFIMLKILVSDIINVNVQRQQQQQPYNNHHDHDNDNYYDKIVKHSDISYIYIKLRDINDNRPKFLQNFQNITIIETLPIGSIVAKFMAIDPDHHRISMDQHDDGDDSGPVNNIHYSLDEQTNRQKYFQIESDTGIVRLNRKLDRETIAVHLIKIIATDMDDEQPLSSMATLVINVDDYNDNAPFIINTTLPSISENIHPPIRLGNIYAFDRDDYMKGNGPPFTFRIDPNASKIIREKFRLESIHNVGGDGHAILYSRQTFDREQQKQYRIPIVVNDSGYPSLSSTSIVTITIADINDNDMKDGWKNVYVFNIDFNQQQQWQTKINNNNDGKDESPPPPPLTTTKNRAKRFVTFSLFCFHFGDY
ncbi:Cadherin-like protein [Euroglyphus maynei]|uniref:Cadherin-like protein n=1 Tax=Euroglyphus maynei TaxID=6958 RepID=A0A1Y3BPA3_EURMA|nr:Cadherin-like protein [Euroglyphus maynei]